MRHHIFLESTNHNIFRVAVLAKATSFNKKELQSHYCNHLVAGGVGLDEIIAFTLDYNDVGKASVSFIKDYLSKLLPALQSLGVKHLYVADANYFKVLTGQSKAEPHLGYVLPCKIAGFEHLTVVLGLNYQQLIYNPQLRDKLNMSLDTMLGSVLGNHRVLGQGIIHSAWYPAGLQEIAEALESLHQYPRLTCDIEGFSLDFDKAGIGTIAFAWNQHEGVAFACDYDTGVSHEDESAGLHGFFHPRAAVRELLKKFFEEYQGELVFHNAPYDCKVLIYSLWMQHLEDTAGLLKGLDILSRNFHDTKVIAYLATNSTAGNVLGLKPLAHEFAGNWAVEEIKDIRKVPLDKLLQYNLVDALCTQYVFSKYWPRMRADLQEPLYHDLMMPSQKLIIQIELTGMPLDKARVAVVKQQLQDIEALHLGVIQNSTLIATLNLLLRNSAMDKDYQDRLAKSKTGKIKTKDISEFADLSFNPGSPKQLQVLLYEQMGLPILDRTDTGQPATGQETLEKLINHCQHQDYKDLLQALIGWAQVTKILSTYIPAFELALQKGDHSIVWLHGSFNLGGTVSGRLSSCVAAWTRISTQRGLVPISELQIGDQVWTHNRRWRPVEDIILKPVTPMVDVQFCSGYILTCTMDHKLRLPDGTWKPVKDIIDERIEIVDAGPCEHFSSLGCLPEQSPTDRGTDCSGSGNPHSQHQSRVDAASSGCGISGSQGTAVLHLEDGGAQSDEGQNPGTAPQLDRGVFGRQGLPDHPAQRRTAVCASSGHGASLGPGNPAGASGGAPHRREPLEQCAGQPGLGDTDGAHEDSLAASDVGLGKIQAIHYRGPLPVWDITVAEDHSYWAEGCFNHNSDPNLQNLPANSIYGELIKSCFVAPPGWLFCGADFNSLEDYISALTTKDPNKLDVYIRGFDGHCLRAAYYYADVLTMIDKNDPKSVNSIKKLYPELRQDSKTPTFALTYQGTYHTLMKNLGWDMEKAKAIEAAYHDMYKVSDQYIHDRLVQASKDGFVTVAFGLRVRTPLLAQVVFKGHKMPYEAAAEGRTAGNAMGQSYGLLNNRAAVAFWQKVWASKYRLDILPVALIHDAIYALVRDDIETVTWANKHLIEEMRWQNLPEIQHPVVKIGAALDVFWPSWANKITLPNDADADTIFKTCQAGKAEFLNPKKEAA